MPGTNAGCGIDAGGGQMVSRAIMRHLLYVRRLRQLLGGDAGQRVESVLVARRQESPISAEDSVANYFAAAGGTTAA